MFQFAHPLKGKPKNEPKAKTNMLEDEILLMNAFLVIIFFILITPVIQVHLFQPWKILAQLHLSLHEKVSRVP